MEKYGKTDYETDVEKLRDCRLIIKEIMDYGVTENQKKQIIKLLSLELEDIAMMKQIADILEDQKETSDKKLIYIK